MIAYILTMVIMASNQTSSSVAATSFSVVYTSKEKCELARNINREALKQGTVILATCTPQ